MASSSPKFFGVKIRLATHPEVQAKSLPRKPNPAQPSNLPEEDETGLGPFTPTFLVSCSPQWLPTTQRRGGFLPMGKRNPRKKRKTPKKWHSGIAHRPPKKSETWRKKHLQNGHQTPHFFRLHPKWHRDPAGSQWCWMQELHCIYHRPADMARPAALANWMIGKEF